METITQVQLNAHDSFEKGIWVSYKNKVYDVTKFALDHPGGTDLILQYAGQDITEIFDNKEIHVHSKSAMQILKGYEIGEIAISNEAEKAQEREKKDKIEHDQDEFIDINKPLVYQMWNSQFDKRFYMKQVHIPRYLPHPATFFSNPLLEVFTRTPWWFIPLFWLPILSTLLYQVVESKSEIMTPTNMGLLFVVGLFLWTLVEYTLHRFLFHVDSLLPDHRVFLTLHFLLHGVHHFLPMDSYRLVMPPALSIPIALSVFNVLLAIIRDYHVSLMIFIGVGSGYIIYDLVHYYLHHGTPLFAHLRKMKTYHINHHYLNAELGFGITSKLWDLVFDTALPDKIKGI